MVIENFPKQLWIPFVGCTGIGSDEPHLELVESDCQLRLCENLTSMLKIHCSLSAVPLAIGYAPVHEVGDSIRTGKSGDQGPTVMFAVDQVYARKAGAGEHRMLQYSANQQACESQSSARVRR